MTELADLCKVLLYYEAQSEERRERLSRRLHKNIRRFEYQDGDWFITGPKNVKEIIAEGILLEKGLYKYIPNMLYAGDIIVLFMRRKNKPHKPCVTIEIVEGNVIRLASQIYDEPPDEEQERVLQKFAKAKELIEESNAR